MFKVIDLGPEGKPEESQDASRVAPPPAGITRWPELVRSDALVPFVTGARSRWKRWP